MLYHVIYFIKETVDKTRFIARRVFTILKNRGTGFPFDADLKGLDAECSVFFFLTTSDSEETLKKIRHLQRFFPVIVAYEDKIELEFPEDVKVWTFNHLLSPFPVFWRTVVPGGTLYVAMQFLLDHEYENIWFIEDDVTIKGGDWSVVKDLDVNRWDFIGGHIPNCTSEDFCHRKTMRTPSASPKIDEYFNVLCALSYFSRAAASHIIQLLQEGYKGHHETIIPTLLNRDGYKVCRFENFDLLHYKHFRFAPVLTREEIDQVAEGKILHPVKDFNIFAESTFREREGE